MVPRSSPLPFPSISVFCIYSTTPLSSVHTATPSDEPAEDDHDDATLEASKLLFFYSPDELVKERRARLMGTVMGLADFARMLSPPGAPALRSVHSLKQRMVWYEAEKGIFIHASIELPRAPRHTREGSSATISSVSGATIGSGMNDASLLSSLQCAYRMYKLHHGSILGPLQERGKEQVVRTLSVFWEDWVRKWEVERVGGAFERVVGGLKGSPLRTRDLATHLVPLLAQFQATNLGAIPILLHSSAVLHLPVLSTSSTAITDDTRMATTASQSTTTSSSRTRRSLSPSLTEGDLTALVTHLISLSLASTSISLSHPSSHSVKVSKEGENPHRPSSKWNTYTLGMGSYLTPTSLPTMAFPPLPSFSPFSSPTLPSSDSFPPPPAPEPSQAPQIAPKKLRSAYSTWTLRDVNWVGMGAAMGLGGGNGARQEAVKSASEAVGVTELSPHGMGIPVVGDLVGLGVEDGRERRERTDSVVSVVAPTDPTALEEALVDVEVALPVEEAVEDDVVEQEIQQEEEQELSIPFSIFCSGDTKIEVQTFQRGPLFLAIVSLPNSTVSDETVDPQGEGSAHWLHRKAGRLLEAVETLLDPLDVHPSTLTAFPHRHLIKSDLLTRSHGWPTKAEWSGRNREEEAEVETGLLACSQGFTSNPSIVETFLRLSSSQWLTSRRSTSLISGSSTIARGGFTDMYAILPAKVGKEGSLMDAEDGLRRIERNWIKTHLLCTSLPTALATVPSQLLSQFTEQPHKMVKITTKILEEEKAGRMWCSFEFFPPKTNDGWANLYDRISRMQLLGPLFADITWGAGGATSEATTAFVKTAHAELGLETCMHLTCTNMPVAMVDAALKEAYDSGCRNILALRGDPPRGSEEWVKTEGGFNHAIDLIRHIRTHYGDYFDIGIAGFPEGHPQSESPSEEMKYLKEKVDAGANMIFTQMFYDADIFIAWGRQVRAAGITIPIIPGIMPIQTYASFKRRTAFSKTIISPHLVEMLEPIQGDDQLVREVGTKFVAGMVRKILAAGLGIHGIHCYTMNLSKGTEMLLEELNFVPSADVVKPLPWRLSLTPNRRTETTRPIFWSNRQRSYLSRTADWDEFPNGRWGDQASPAFGELDLSLSLPHTPSGATTLWGHPLTISDLTKLFARFCRGDLKSLPWCDQGPSKETSVISEPLARINEEGFLTINSQPRVDGVKSNDPSFGWGPKDGYVYQKAYLEFFASPEALTKLLALVDQSSASTYLAVNKQGDLRTNTNDGPNAVTWGVFPGAEVIQPTVVDASAFLAWKDEAFELGAQWATLYTNTSPASAELLKGIMDTYYLVNIVYNDYRDSNDLAIFEPFFALSQSKSTPLVNGTTA